MAKKGSVRSKFPALVLYVITVLVLIAALILPLETKTLSSAIDFKNNMPLMQLGGALVSIGILKEIPFGTALTTSYSFPVSAFGKTIDVGAALLLLYALATVVSLILLIPACCIGRNKPAGRGLCAAGEIAPACVLFPMAFITLTYGAGNYNLSVLAAFGMCVLALVVQSMIYYRGSGVIKTALVVLSAISAFFLLPAATIGGKFGELLATLAGKINGKAPFDLNPALFEINGGVLWGASFVSALLTDPSLLAVEGKPLITVTYYIALGLTVLVCVNLLIDILGLGKRTNRFMLVCNLIRYIAQTLLAAGLAVMLLFSKGNYGFALCVALVLSLAQLIIQIVRSVRYKPVKEEEAAPAPEAETATPAAEEAPEAEMAASSAPAAAEPETVVETRNVVYNVNTIYNGPTDNFIKKLSNDEKVEFARIFLERRIGNVSGIPDYVVGGDNSRFFTGVFIYFARVRDIVSDGLMNKLYEEVNLTC